MAGYLSNAHQNYSPLNPIPIYKSNLPSNFEKIKDTRNQDTRNQDTQSPDIRNQYAINAKKNKDYKNNNTDGYYEKYQESNTIDYDRARQATQGFFSKNEITILFFSNENMKRIQKKIKEEIYSKTKGQYTLDEDQDEADLTIVMRSIYLDKCKNLPNETIRQVKLLNDQTVDYIVPDMISNIKQYFGYVKDINEPLKPMMRPMNVNSAGRRLLPSITTLWR